jgi:hypothetical protein
MIIREPICSNGESNLFRNVGIRMALLIHFNALGDIFYRKGDLRHVRDKKKALLHIGN